MNSTRRTSPKLEIPGKLAELPRVSFTRERPLNLGEETDREVAFDVRSIERAVSEFDKRVRIKR
jgi:hypothetical protein